MDKNVKLSDLKISLAFEVGDLVTSEYYPEDAHVTRVITKVERNTATGSTIRIWASEGVTCTGCKRPLSKTIDGVDGAWFLPERRK